MRKPLLAVLVSAACATFGAHAAGVTDAMIDNDAATPNDILSWGMGSQGQRYSPLKQVNAQTINRLVPAWSFSFGGEKQRGQQSQPLVHEGRMFVTGSYSRIYALDVKTGQKLWKYEHRLPEGIMPCCDVINRGAALYDNLVIFGTLDAQLVALDQKTGDVVWKEKIDDYAAGYSYTAAPLIAGGLLLTGVSGGEFGVIGRVEARDPRTGKMVWLRPTVEGHMGYTRARPTPPGRATCTRPAARAPGSAAPTTRPPASPTSAPATRARGTATCARATTSIRAAPSRST
jgi:alcohol dehydrogenase (cytochrome c)